MSNFLKFVSLLVVLSSLCSITNAVECDVCQLQGETGHCRARKIMYFFNVNKFQCEKFVYGGCGGNANRFETKEDCMSSCGGTTTK
ncbi:hypothetical protein JTE90_015873 [Oedothorax gibbosus]|uniref:BPTI/Kunitz inhibitor domain-containing protein n=1 Tax=Oedothorax gibbosus TaxID=931172 RepID=A0AAV6VT64_9ARAC|nr:hypothetical protein JTE90_015873 [Oedothorax gibbosus]